MICRNCKYWEDATPLDSTQEVGFCHSKHWATKNLDGNKDIYFAMEPDAKIYAVETTGDFYCPFFVDK